MAPLIPVGAVAAKFGIGPGELVAIVGGGGKTTTMFAIADAAPVNSVIVTTTTKMGVDQTQGRPSLVSPSDAALTSALASQGSIVIWGSVDGQRAIGVDAERCDRFIDLADLVVVEADGARRKPFKAPKPYEPVIPLRTSRLIACIGSDALGEVIADRCHRPDNVAAVAGCNPDDRLTPARAARVLLADNGSRKGCPSGARFHIVVTKVDHHTRPLAEELADELSSAANADRYDSVALIEHLTSGL